MDKLLFGVCVFTGLLQVFAQTDLSGKVFVFPRESATDHVTLTPAVDKPLQSFTLCFWYYTDLSRPYSLFSYNTPGKDNELLLYKEKAGEYSLYIGQSKVTFKVKEVSSDPVHVCTSWESNSGIAELWVDGKRLVRKGLKQGYSVAAHPKIVLGQEQDSLGGAFDKTQSLVGEIGELYMWDSVLSTDEIRLVYHQGSYPNPNYLDWRNLIYDSNGYVVIKPQVWT